MKSEVNFSNGSKIILDDTPEEVTRGKSVIFSIHSKDDEEFEKIKSNLIHQIRETESVEVMEKIKFMDAKGQETKEAIHYELLNKLTGYDHDPATHNYNRAERRRIIKAAKKLEKNKKGR
ncbi:hypothetical protein [Microcystis phage MaeS]|nr:hypothetical protein [Microcystis phage MaeS]